MFEALSIDVSDPHAALFVVMITAVPMFLLGAVVGRSIKRENVNKLQEEILAANDRVLTMKREYDRLMTAAQAIEQDRNRLTEERQSILAEQFEERDRLYQRMETAEKALEDLRRQQDRYPPDELK